MGYAEFERYANDRVEDMLETYAEHRLDPTSPALARIRANVMAQATQTAAARRVLLNAPSLAPATSRFAWLKAPLPRRAMALGLAASLTLGTTAAVLAAPPGSAFYNARLVIETALMPSVAHLDARLAAYEEHLERRLQEAEAAAAAGDASGLAAALAAYESDMALAVAEVGDDSDRLAHLEAMLTKHTGVLEALEATLPEQASIDNAIVNSQKAVANLKEKAEHIGTGGNGGSGGNGGNGGPPDNEPHGPPDNPGQP